MGDGGTRLELGGREGPREEDEPAAGEMERGARREEVVPFIVPGRSCARTSEEGCTGRAELRRWEGTRTPKEMPTRQRALRPSRVWTLSDLLSLSSTRNVSLAYRKRTTGPQPPEFPRPSPS